MILHILNILRPDFRLSDRAFQRRCDEANAALRRATDRPRQIEALRQVSVKARTDQLCAELGRVRP